MQDANCPRTLSDEKLLSGVARLVQDDNENAAEMLRYLDAVEQRGLHLRLGHSSMWSFCIDRFHMSEPTASKRIGAMRTARRFPVIFEMVARGGVHLSGLCALKAHLTEENHRTILAEAEHKTLREIDELVARLAPKPDVPTRIRAVPRRTPAPAERPQPSLFTREAEREKTPPVASAPELAAPPTAAPSRRAPDPTPLSPRSYKATMTFDEETMSDLGRLQGLLAPEIPDGDPAKIVKRALRRLREQVEARKYALTDKPRSTSLERSRASRAIPAAIRRAVHERDGGRCGFIGEDGRRCNETRALEYAHVRPYAKGGAHSVDNLGERCRAHNQHEADRDFGPLFMQRKRAGARSVREPVAVYGAVALGGVP